MLNKFGGGMPGEGFFKFWAGTSRELKWSPMEPNWAEKQPDWAQMELSGAQMEPSGAQIASHPGGRVFRKMSVHIKGHRGLGPAPELLFQSFREGRVQHQSYSFNHSATTVSCIKGEVSWERRCLVSKPGCLVNDGLLYQKRVSWERRCLESKPGWFVNRGVSYNIYI